MNTDEHGLKRGSNCFRLLNNSTLFVICVHLCSSVANSSAADVESRVLTHYLPQDFLETAVRKEDWTEVVLPLKGGRTLRKGDTIRVWAGGLIDRGNGDQPGENCNGPAGCTSTEKAGVALSADPSLTYAL